MTLLQMFQANIFSPMVLAFAFGIVCRLIKSELAMPRDLYTSLSIYLLFSLGLKGGVELSHCELRQLFLPAMVTIGLGVFTPVNSFVILRYVGRFSIADAAGIAAHYGSVSAVTFIAAEKFVTANLAEATTQPFMPTLLTILEVPGIQIALALGLLGMAKARSAEARKHQSVPSESHHRSLGNVWHDLLTARSMVLLVGGMIIGLLIGYEDLCHPPTSPRPSQSLWACHPCRASGRATRAD
jgi:hypothetical protein